jgi:hypothetical protein
VKYTIAARPTKYNGVQFRSRLEARWAAFFDLAGWEWEYEPIDFNNWVPDFLVTIKCTHSECGRVTDYGTDKEIWHRDGCHRLYVEVKPYGELSEFEGHPVSDFTYQSFQNGRGPGDPVGAMFGLNPDVTAFDLIHGAGSGVESVHCRIHNADDLWKEAGNTVQWSPRK